MSYPVRHRLLLVARTYACGRAGQPGNLTAPCGKDMLHPARRGFLFIPQVAEINPWAKLVMGSRAIQLTPSRSDGVVLTREETSSGVIPAPKRAAIASRMPSAAGGFIH